MKDHPIRGRERPSDTIHVPFVVASIAIAVVAGFTLAVSLPLEAVLASVDAGWVSHAQVHGHLQVIGFAGLFVVGVSFRLAPRFGGRHAMAMPGAEYWVLALLLLGLTARSLGQPLAGHPPAAVIMALGAWAELAGAMLYSAMLALTLSDALRARQPHALLLWAGSVGFALQAALGAWWLTDLATEGGTILATARNQVLLHLQFFGFLLPAILGVGMRTFPTFFGRRPPGDGAAGVVAALALGGVLLWTAGGLATSEGVADAWPWSVAGQAVVGAGILGAIVAFGPWRPVSRLAPASRGLAWALHPAVLWLAVTGVLLVGTAIQAAVGGGPVRSVSLDAVRHVFAVGVVTLAIAGMAQLILPEFASERLVRSPGQWRGPLFGVALSVAAALRGIALLAGVEGDARWWLMATAGSVAWAVLALFAAIFWTASRSHRAYLQRINRFRSNELRVVDSG